MSERRTKLTKLTEQERRFLIEVIVGIAEYEIKRDEEKRNENSKSVDSGDSV